jgi:hypothetical protein
MISTTHNTAAQPLSERLLAEGFTPGLPPGLGRKALQIDLHAAAEWECACA